MWAHLADAGSLPGQTNVWGFLTALALALLGTGAAGRAAIRRRKGPPLDDADPEPAVTEAVTRTVDATNDQFLDYLKRRVEELKDQLTDATRATREEQNRTRQEQARAGELEVQLATKRAQLHALRNELALLEDQVHRPRPRPGGGAHES